MHKIVISDAGSFHALYPTRPIEPISVEGAKLFQSIYNTPLSLEQTQEILTSQPVETLKGWIHLGHPLLHEAVAWQSQGALTILLVVLTDPTLSPLLNDPTYKDKYGYTVVKRLSKYLWGEKPELIRRIAQLYNVQPSFWPN